jgi:hypothetical protein
MDFSLTAPSLFPEGTTVGAYPMTNWAVNAESPSGEPPGAAADTQSMAGGGLTFTGLGGGEYWAAAEVGEEWRYVRFSTQTPVQLSGYSSVNAETVSAFDPSKWTTLDIIEGIEVPESGRLDVSYAALFQVAGYVEAPGNTGHFALFLDDEQIRATPGGELLQNLIAEDTAFWVGLRTGLLPKADFYELEVSGEDAPAYGAFLAPEAWSIAAEPGTHDISFRAKPGEPDGGTFSVKQRRLVAITGTV